MRILTIPKELDRGRVDAALHELAPALSRRVARKLVDSGAVARAGVRAQSRDHVRTGEPLAFYEETVDASIALSLGVFYENNDFLIVSKPPGLASHGGPLVKDSVAARIANIYKSGGLAHRLDRGTSGLFIIGKSPEGLRGLAARMEGGQIIKHYRTIVAGVMLQNETRIDAPLRVLDEPMGNKPKVIVDARGGQPAVTNVRVIARFERYSYLNVTIETGRTHQIRAHLAHAGHPILGDPRYGDDAKNEWARDTLGVARPLLHCHRLACEADDLTFDREAFTEPDFARTLKFFQAFAPEK